MNSYVTGNDGAQVCVHHDEYDRIVDVVCRACGYVDGWDYRPEQSDNDEQRTAMATAREHLNNRHGGLDEDTDGDPGGAR